MIRNARLAALAAATIVTVASVAAARAASSGPHLYVAESGALSVMTFPLTNGVVAQEPDNLVYVGAPVDAIALGQHGELFALSYVSGQPSSLVHVYRRGASGIEPVPLRTLNIQNAGPSWAPNPNAIAVDDAGALYVPVTVKSSGLIEVLVYAPGASGNAAPIQTIPIAHEFAGGIAVDERGHLFVAYSDFLYSAPPRGGQGRPSEYFGFVTEYATPKTNPTVVRRLCTRNQLLDIATMPHRTLAVTETGIRPPYNTDIALFDVEKMRCGPGIVEHRVVALVHGGLRGGYGPFGLASYGPYLFEGGQPPSNFEALFELRANGGVQKPVTVVTGLSSYLNGISDLKIGP